MAGTAGIFARCTSAAWQGRARRGRERRRAAAGPRGALTASGAEPGGVRGSDARGGGERPASSRHEAAGRAVIPGLKPPRGPISAEPGPETATGAGGAHHPVRDAGAAAAAGCGGGAADQAGIASRPMPGAGGPATGTGLGEDRSRRRPRGGPGRGPSPAAEPHSAFRQTGHQPPGRRRLHAPAPQGRAVAMQPGTTPAHAGRISGSLRGEAARHACTGQPRPGSATTRPPATPGGAPRSRPTPGHRRRGACHTRMASCAPGVVGSTPGTAPTANRHRQRHRGPARPPRDACAWARPPRQRRPRAAAEDAAEILE